jgi:hypothetical protein
MNFVYSNRKTMTPDQIRQFITGEWESIATELRPSIVKDEKGNLKPIYCSRKFNYSGNDRFELAFTTYADPNGRVPLARMDIKGHIRFGKPHPVAEGAYELDYLADESFTITPLHEGLTHALNQGPPDEGLDTWVTGTAQQVRGKSVPAFGLIKGQDFNEFDLIYIYGDMIFNGSRNADGRPFDSPENRPTNLQIPLVRKK